MRILLREKREGSFYAADGQWTSSICDAHSFETCFKVLEKVAALKLQDVEILLAFPNPQYNLILTVPCVREPPSAYRLDPQPKAIAEDRQRDMPQPPVQHLPGERSSSAPLKPSAAIQ